MTPEEFRKGWDLLVSAFPSHHTTPETYITWLKLLEPMPFKLFVEGVKHVLATHKYSTFPTPAEVLAALDGDSTYRGTPAQKLESYRRQARQPAIAQDPAPPFTVEESRRRFGVVMKAVSGQITNDEALAELQQMGDAEKEESKDE